MDAEHFLVPAIGGTAFAGAPNLLVSGEVFFNFQYKSTFAIVAGGGKHHILPHDGIGGIHALGHARAEPMLEKHFAGFGIQRHEALPHEAKCHAPAVHGGQHGRGVAGLFLHAQPVNDGFSGPAELGGAVPGILAHAGPHGFAVLQVKGCHAAVGLTANHGDEQVALQHGCAADAKEIFDDLKILLNIAPPNGFAGLQVQTKQHAFGTVGDAAVLGEHGHTARAVVVAVGILVGGRVGMAPDELAGLGVEAVDDFLVKKFLDSGGHHEVTAAVVVRLRGADARLGDALLGAESCQFAIDVRDHLGKRVVRRNLQQLAGAMKEHHLAIPHGHRRVPRANALGKHFARAVLRKGIQQADLFGDVIPRGPEKIRPIIRQRGRDQREAKECS